MTETLSTMRAERPAQRPPDRRQRQGWRRCPAPVLAAATAALLVLPTSLAGLSLPVLVVLLARRLPGETTARRLALTAPVLLGTNAAVLTALAVAGLRADARWVVAAYLVLLVLAEALRPATPSLVRFADRTDAWAAATGALVFSLLFRPFAGASVERLSALLSRSTDGGTHVSLVRAVLRESGYVGLLPSASGTLPGLVDYPSGWAGSVAGLVQVALGSDDNLRAFLTAVAFSVVGLYALVAHLAVVAALEVARAVGGRLTTGGAAAGAACVALSTVAGATALLPISSSFAQIAATTVLLASTCVVVAARRGDLSPTPVLAVLAVGLFHTWYLLAPVLAALLLVHLAAHRPPLRGLLSWGVPAVLLASYPVLTGPEPGTQLVAAGGTHGLSGPAFSALLVVTLVALVVLLVGSPGGRAARLAVAAALVAGFLLTAGVLAAQAAGGGSTYYALKLLYSVCTLSAVAAGGVLATALGRRQHGASLLAGALALVVLGSLAFSSVAMRDVVARQLAGDKAGLPDERALKAVLSRHGGQRPEGVDIWVVGDCNRMQDRKTAQWLHSVQLAWDPRLLVAFNAFLRAEPDDLSMLAERARDPDVQRLEVYVHGDCPPSDLPALAALPNVEVIDV